MLLERIDPEPAAEGVDESHDLDAMAASSARIAAEEAEAERVAAEQAEAARIAAQEAEEKNDKQLGGQEQVAAGRVPEPVAESISTEIRAYAVTGHPDPSFCGNTSAAGPGMIDQRTG